MRAVRLYDRRMAGGPGSSTATAWRAPMVAGFVPTHLKAELLRPRTFGYSRCVVALKWLRCRHATLRHCRRCSSPAESIFQVLFHLDGHPIAQSTWRLPGVHSRGVFS